LGWVGVVGLAAFLLPVLPSWGETKEDQQDSDQKPTTVRPKSPDFKGQKVEIAAGDIEVQEFLRFLADYTGLPVIVDSSHRRCLKGTITIPAPMEDVTGDMVVAILKANKFLVTQATLPNGDKVWNVEPTTDRRLEQVEEKLDRILKELENLRPGGKTES